MTLNIIMFFCFFVFNSETHEWRSMIYRLKLNMIFEKIVHFLIKPVKLVWIFFVFELWLSYEMIYHIFIMRHQVLCQLFFDWKIFRSNFGRNLFVSTFLDFIVYNWRVNYIRHCYNNIKERALRRPQTLRVDSLPWRRAPSQEKGEK